MTSRKRPTISKRLRELRTRKGVSLRTAARGIGCSNPYLSQIETGQETNPSMKYLLSAARYYEVTVAYLIGETEAA